ncbi:MAG: sarcosine oxidase [Pseudomonadales bacterium]
MSASVLSVLESTVLRKSPLHRVHLAAGGTMIESELGEAVGVYRSEITDREAAAHLGLVDLCLQPRSGFKGGGSSDYLRTFSIDLPSGPNRARFLSEGVLVSQLSFDEYLLLETTTEACNTARAASQAWSMEDTRDCYEVPRQDSHGCLAVVGAQAANTLSSLISVDLRSQHFENLFVAQTLLNEVSVIVIRQDLGFLPNFFLLADISAMEYLWTVLLDAMGEDGGAAVGLEAFHWIQSGSAGLS